MFLNAAQWILSLIVTMVLASVSFGDTDIPPTGKSPLVERAWKSSDKSKPQKKSEAAVYIEMLQRSQVPSQRRQEILDQRAVHALGPESGGGGGTVFVDGKIMLLDFFNLPHLLPHLETSYRGLSPSRIKSSTSEEMAFLQNQNISDPAFAKAVAVLEKWEAVPFDVIGLLIHGALTKPLIWKFTDDLLPTLSFYKAATLSQELQPITTAYYSMKDIGDYRVLLSRPVWNRLSFENQVGLVIHESLRQVQIGQGKDFDDESLQKVTAVLMMCRPSVRLDQYLLFLSLNKPAIAEERFGKFEMIVDHCSEEK